MLTKLTLGEKLKVYVLQKAIKALISLIIAFETLARIEELVG